MEKYKKTCFDVVFLHVNIRTCSFPCNFACFQHHYIIMDNGPIGLVQTTYGTYHTNVTFSVSCYLSKTHTSQLHPLSGRNNLQYPPNHSS